MKIIVTSFLVLALAGLVVISSLHAQESQAGVSAQQKEIKACPPGCTKPCCTLKEDVKACPPGCTKPCCALKEDVKAYPPGCIKPCCARKKAGTTSL